MGQTTVTISGDKIATRDAYGKALIEVGKDYPQVVVLDADLSCSTKTIGFAKAFPERFFNMGVSEQDMMGTAAGLALSGKIPFASTFAMFAVGRAFEIVRNSIVYPHLPVKICATHAGLTVGEDGASHQTIADIAVMRVLPGMTVIVPADAVETQQVIHQIIEWPGPVYVRLSRAASPVFLGSDYRFQIGKAAELRSGKDIAIVACGLMVSHALQAADLLEKQGIHATVVNMATIKPLDAELLHKLAREIGILMTVEEHSVLGGLGSAVAECLAEDSHALVHRYGVMDQFGQSGPAEALLKHYQLMPEDLAEQAILTLKKRK
ncbi:MAG TPA: transketolase [Deltaproteobacteria bacterium]|nr:transketolase [Deltaproteobacteria bacterium]